MAVQPDMKNPRLPCKTRLNSNPCNWANTRSMLRCKTAVPNKMESKEVKLISHVNQFMQVTSPPNGRRARDEHHAQGHAWPSSSRRATKVTTIYAYISLYPDIYKILYIHIYIYVYTQNMSKYIQIYKDIYKKYKRYQAAARRRQPGRPGTAGPSPPRAGPGGSGPLRAVTAWYFVYILCVLYRFVYIWIRLDIWDMSWYFSLVM